MGIGQVVTLKLPPERLRAVNLAIEQNAWGAFETEFYPTYDFRPIWQGIKERALATGATACRGTPTTSRASAATL
jgi:hypothetical protein